MLSWKENNVLRFQHVQLDDLPQVAREILEFARCNVNVLQAPMGCGKTTLCSQIIKQWGSTTEGSSPTFSLVEEHQGPKGTLYHADAYRIEEEEEAYDIGFEEYIESGNPLWIEWAEKVESFLPYKVGVVYIKIEDIHTRTIEFYSELYAAQIQWNHE